MTGIRGQSVEVSPFSQANFGGYTPAEQAEITRPHNATPYSAGDIVVGRGSGVARTFQLVKPNNNNGYIIGGKLTSSDAGLSGLWRIHIMNQIPDTFADNDPLNITNAEMQTNYIANFYLTVETIGGTNVGFPTDVDGNAIDLRVPYYTNGKQGVAIAETVSGCTFLNNSSTIQLTLQYENNAPNAPAL